MNKEEFIKKLTERGIDSDIAESMFKRAEKAGQKKEAKRKLPPGVLDRPKKYVGKLEITEICQTCGSRFTHNIITEIDPNKDRETDVPVSICSGCISLYRCMDQDTLIALILLKDHPDLTLRTLSNKTQIKIAQRRTPGEVLQLRSELEPAQDDRYLKPDYE